MTPRPTRRAGASLITGATVAGSLLLAHLAGATIPASASAATPDATFDAATGGPVWVVGTNGGITSPVGSPALGVLGRLAAPVVGGGPTADGQGYWLVGSDGGVFAFGDAPYLGSTGGLALDAPIVAIAPTPSGHGYWLVASDGGVFAFGDAGHHGATGSNPPAVPMRTMAADPAGGYWLADQNGAVYQFGPVGARPPMVVPTAPLPIQPRATTSAAQAAVAFAEAQVGKPYVWGATGPSGYDCWGLTQAAWGAAGVPLARVASDQFADGAQVPVSAAQPGDLLFWSSNGSPSGIYHVGIDVGGGLMVDAPHPGAAVTVEPIYGGVYPVAVQP